MPWSGSGRGPAHAPERVSSRGAFVEVALFRKAGRAARRVAVARAGGLDVAGHLEQVRAHRVQAMVFGHPVVGVERVEQGEPGTRAVHHCDRDRTVQRDHRVGRDPLQQVVEGDDLGPVGVVVTRCLVVDRGDRGLDLVRADAARPAACA